MSTVTIYHNPRCSKSRATLELLKQHQITPEVVLYLEHPPSANTLQTLVQQLGFHSASQLLRTGEDLYRELKLNRPDISEQELLQAMAQHPRLIERPIVVCEGEARLGRPPENVLEILPDA
ncbi:MAG: arsenate reductase (glutaredoxin) [Enterobacteriaceae bacterium]